MRTMDWRGLKYIVFAGAVICLVLYVKLERRGPPSIAKLRAKQNNKFPVLPYDSFSKMDLLNSSLINLLTAEKIQAERQKIQQLKRDDTWIRNERQELQQAKESLEEERERLEDEREALGIAVKLGLAHIKPQHYQDTPREEQNKYMDGLGPADAKQYRGLNSTVVHTKYPGIAFMPDYRIHEFLDALDTNSLIMKRHPKSINDVDDFLAEERFYELIGESHIECLDVKHMGNKEDGGWDVCLSEPYTPTKNDCLVYSFGIANDFTFDDAMMYGYGCYVRAFDPSMTIGDHKHNSKVWFYQLGLGATNTVNSSGWKLETLGSIIAKSGHTGRIIDVLKMDIEHNEWTCLKTIYKEGVLSNVKQLVIEIHTPEMFLIDRPSTREDFYDMYNTLLELEKLGFRRFKVHYNHFGQYISLKSGQHRTCCYELSYININYLTI